MAGSACLLVCLLIKSLTCKIYLSEIDTLEMRCWFENSERVVVNEESRKLS